jgi:type II secretory pathway component PulF
MTCFVYKAKSAPDRVVSGTLQASDRDQAVHQVMAMGCSLLSLRESADGKGAGGAMSWRLARRVSGTDLAVFWRQLASLLQAGMPLVKSLETVGQQTENRRLSAIIADVRDAVQNASSFSAALERHAQVFGAVAGNLVASAEAMGALPQVAAQLAVKVEKEQDLRGKVRSALVYPIFLLLVGLGVVGVLVTVVIPRFAVLFAGMGQELPLPTRMLLGVSRFAQSYGWIVALVALAAFAAIRQATRTGKGRLAMDRFKLHLPFLGKVVQKTEMARFAHTLATLCTNGVRILGALEISARTVGNRVIAQEILDVRDRVAKGSRVEAALRKGRFFPPTLVNMVAVGEDSAALDKMIENVAVVFERDSDRVANSVARLLESALILVLGAMVAAIVAAILLPIFQATSLAE